MRRLILALALVLPLADRDAAVAEEPLLLRIRPAPADAVGDGGAETTAEDVGRRARMASEAIWERSTTRARIAIASVCTGCMGPSRPEPSMVRPADQRIRQTSRQPGPEPLP